MRIVHTLPAPADSGKGRVQEALRRLAVDGLTRRGICQEPARAQLDWELQRLTDSGRASQYLMLRDIILRARDQGIPVSPGYGRMGNSVLAYALGLCEPDPYAYGLVFPKSTHIYGGGFGINVSAERAYELIGYVKSEYMVDDHGNAVDLVELPALDLMQAVVERVGLVGDQRFWASVRLDDLKTFKLLGDGDTDGVYQLDTEAAKNHLREWRPATFTDLLVLATLNCYGTEELIPEVIERARDKTNGSCREPLLSAVTAESYGLLIWQEQIIRVLIELAGYDGGMGDGVRRALRRKRPDENEVARVRFVADCASHRGLPEPRAQSVWEELDKYAVCAMSKAHIVAHGLLTYRMAYLKARWRGPFEAEMDDRKAHSGFGRAQNTCPA